MRLLLLLMTVAAALWSGAWFAAARMAERAAETWFAEAAAEGYRAGYDHLSVSGFPFRLWLEVEAPRLADPLRGLDWAAPAVAAGVTLAAPGRLRILPGLPQTLRTPLSEIALAAGTLTAEAPLGRDLAPAALHVRAEAAALEATPVAGVATGQGGWRLGIDRLAADLGLTGSRLVLGLAAEGIAFDPAEWPAALAPLPAAPIRRVELVAAAVHDAPAEAGGRLVALDLEALRIDWGPTDLLASGRLEIGPDGLPEGRITASAGNWRPLLALAVAAGLVAPELAPTWERVFATLEAAGPEAARSAGRLELPVVFARGRVSLGPLPLGPAPLLAPPLPAPPLPAGG